MHPFHTFSAIYLTSIRVSSISSSSECFLLALRLKFCVLCSFFPFMLHASSVRSTVYQSNNECSRAEACKSDFTVSCSVPLLLPLFDPNTAHTKSQPVHLYSETVLLGTRMAFNLTTYAAHRARWLLCRLNK